MAYSSTNPPVPAMGTLTRASTTASLYPAPQLWLYRSSDGSTLVTESTGYFTNGFQLGMRIGDALIGTKVSSHGSSAMLIYLGVVTSQGSTGLTVVSASSLVGST